MFSRSFGLPEETSVDRSREAFDFQCAGVAELVDARDLKSLFPLGSEGSIPSLRTRITGVVPTTLKIHLQQNTRHC